MSQFKKLNPQGESWVWLSAMGIVTGLLMVIAVLGLIAYEGISVFWPRNVIQFEVPTEAKIGKNPIVIGELADNRLKKQVSGTKIPEIPPRETQIYTANKDVYGTSFRWFNSELVTNTELPKDIMSMERREHSRVLAFPVSIKKEDGTIIKYGEANFQSEFDRLMNEADDKHHQTVKLTKGPIRDIVDDVKDLEVDAYRVEKEAKQEFLKGKNLAAIEDPAEKTKVLDQMHAFMKEASKEIRAKIDAKNKETEQYTSETDRLGKEIKLNTFTYRTGSGEEKTEPFGNIVHYYYPNQLSTGGKVALFVGNAWRFLSNDPREANTEGGVFPAIIGTLIMTILMCIFVTPLGVIAAIYLREYAKQGAVVRMVRIAINNLAGVPSIVFGAFGLGFFVYKVGGSVDALFFQDWVDAGNGAVFKTGGILWASLTLALMTLPVVIVATEEALAAVPKGLREGAIGCGASKWQMIQTVVLPASAPGIITGMILAMARGAGEVAPLMLVGVIKLAPELPIDWAAPFGLELKFMHLGFHIYDLGFQSPDSEAARPMVFATTLLLIVIVGLLNLAGILIRQRLKKKYSTSAF